jgi:hypothetical protein
MKKLSLPREHYGWGLCSDRDDEAQCVSFAPQLFHLPHFLILGWYVARRIAMLVGIRGKAVSHATTWKTVCPIPQDSLTLLERFPLLCLPQHRALNAFAAPPQGVPQGDEPEAERNCPARLDDRHQG